MDRISRMRMQNMNNEDIFAIYTEYVKDSISRDLQAIYKEEAQLVDSEEPWVFKMKKDK